MNTCSKSPKVNFQEDEFQTPIYNVWAFGKKTNEVSHFGNSEQRIVDNLLYLYTEPFDIVLDPFAGGGSTIDVFQPTAKRRKAEPAQISSRSRVLNLSTLLKHPKYSPTNSGGSTIDVFQLDVGNIPHVELKHINR